MSDLDDIVRSAQRAAAACAGQDARSMARVLAEAGLFGVLAHEEAGGLGLPISAAAAVLAATEAELLGFPLLETILAARVLPDALAAQVVGGEKLVTIAWGGSAKAAVVTRAHGAEGADLLLCADGHGGGLCVALAGAGIESEPDLDLERPSFRVRVTGGEPIAPAAWVALLADAQLLRAAECLGAADASISAAVAHVSQRKQFGRVLVTMQGLRFELARHKLALENARVVLNKALSRQGDAHAALVARATVAEAAPYVIEGAIQMHGGMGFTWDVPLHRRLRRVLNARDQLDAFDARQGLMAELLA
jgi:alkylation response protein AidB-like acyl-CoA dehydrogenase